MSDEREPCGYVVVSQTNTQEQSHLQREGEREREIGVYLCFYTPTHLLVLPDLGVVGVDSADSIPEVLSVNGSRLGRSVHQWCWHLGGQHVITRPLYHVPQEQPLSKLATGLETYQQYLRDNHLFTTLSLFRLVLYVHTDLFHTFSVATISQY